MEIRKNKTALTAYASDGSIYEIAPTGIVTINNSSDIEAAVKEASKSNLSVTPRGGGTGLAGGALGNGYILDFGQFNNILEINPAERRVKTQVGIIYEELNIALRPFGLLFPPDPSSGDSCQIGGMIANNSSGPRSVKYGLTSDFLEELDIIDASGEMITLRKYNLHGSELKSFLSENPEYQKVLNILRDKKDLIKQRWPKLKKNSSGYNLLQVINELDKGVFNLPALFAGSEGTLGVTAAAVLKLLPIPGKKLTARVYFKSLVDAGKAVEPLLEIGPSGLEIVDGATLDLIGREEFKIPDEAAALLLLEFDENITEKKERFMDLVEKFDLAGPVDFADNPADAAPLWKARKAIVPTLYRHHPTKRPIALVEDVSLPAENIPPFIEYVTDLFHKYNLTFGIFGHIGDGNLHLRPLFDLNDSEDFDRAKSIYETVYDKVIEMGGSTTAEHADGRLRAQVLEKLYGKELVDIFKQIKDALDPDNILSPDSIISGVSFTDKIDNEKIKSYCAACGKCNGYCPAFDIFRREDYGARGWLRILNQSGAERENLDEVLNYCLNCKNCAIVCPAGVDIAGEIIKYRSEKPSAISKLAVALTDREALLNLGLKLGRLGEPILKTNFGKSMVEVFGKPFGMDRSAEFPAIAGKSLRNRFRNRRADFGDIAFFHGCADNLLESNVGDAVFKVFDHLGFKVSIPEQKCCGLPQEVYGHRDNLVRKARFNIDHLEKFNSVITGCASCLLRLKEYPELFDKDDPYYKKALELADKSYDISQYLNEKIDDFSQFDMPENMKLTYHNPCHLRGAGLHKEPEKLMNKISNVEIIHPVYPDSCCAQAGSYGFTHFQESKKMFSKKKNDYKSLGATTIMTSCPACKMKIKAEMGGNYNVVHPVEILAERLNSHNKNLKEK